MKIERRFLHELRAESQGDEMSLVGYASKFGAQSQDLGGFRETVMPGAFARSIREGADVKFLMNHDPSMIMGRTKNKTLTLGEDETGLRFKVTLPKTQAARDLHALVSRGDIDQCSFAFTVKDQTWSDERDGNGDMYASRLLNDVDLMDVSAVTYPAYLDTEVDARMFDPDALMEVRSAVSKFLEERIKKGTESGETIGTAQGHKDSSNAHAAQATKEKEAGNVQAASLHQVAADAHSAASTAAHKSAISSEAAKNIDEKDKDGKPNPDHKTANDAAAKSASESSVATEKANLASKMANKASGKGGRSTRGSENQAPRNEAIDLPQPFCPDAKEEWWNAFYDAYDSLMKKGGRGFAIKEALGKAIAAANQLVQPQTEVTPAVDGQGKNHTSIKGDIVDTDGDDDAAQWERSAKRHAELRYSEGTFEDRIEDINCALQAKFGCCAGNWIGCQKYWVIETYMDHVVVCDMDEGCYYDLTYTLDESAEEGKEVTLGEPVKVVQAFVASERALKVAELRSKMADAKRSAEEVSDPDSPFYDPDDSEYDEGLDSSRDNYDAERGKKAFTGEDRDGAKTKKVAGKDLSSGSFAYVGDATDPSTWKLPIHDEAHAKNALARFNQTKGIPADQKEGVWKKIVSAAKKFGITVSEENSLRAGMSHTIATSILSEVDDAAILSAMHARMRMIEIDLD